MTQPTQHKNNGTHLAEYPGYLANLAVGELEGETTHVTRREVAARARGDGAAAKVWGWRREACSREWLRRRGSG